MVSPVRLMTAVQCRPIAGTLNCVLMACDSGMPDLMNVATANMFDRNIFGGYKTERF